MITLLTEDITPPLAGSQGGDWEAGMKTILALVLLGFMIFTPSISAGPPVTSYDLDTFHLFIYPSHYRGTGPYKFSQFVNGLRKLVERECGYCQFYDFDTPLPEESLNPFISLHEKKDPKGYYSSSIIISCPPLTGTNGLIEIEFEYGLGGEVFYDRAYEFALRSADKDEATGRKVADSLFKKVEKFYGWNEKRDTKYDGYLIDMSKLNGWSGRVNLPGYREDFIIDVGISTFKNVKYSYLILCLRFYQWFVTESYPFFYTDANSPGYFADQEHRAVQDHLVKLAMEDGREILRIHSASLKRPVSLVFEPDPERKTLKLEKVLVGKKEMEPNDPSLHGIWEYLALAIEKFSRSN